MRGKGHYCNDLFLLEYVRINFLGCTQILELLMGCIILCNHIWELGK